MTTGPASSSRRNCSIFTGSCSAKSFFDQFVLKHFQLLRAHFVGISIELEINRGAIPELIWLEPLQEEDGCRDIAVVVRHWARQQIP